MALCPACLRETGAVSGASCPFCGISVLDSQTRSALLDSQVGPVDDARFAPGRLFASRYRIVTLLGRGAMGEVYRAEDLRIGQPVALKLLAAARGHDSDGLRRFISEVRLARGIAHPNVCRVFDISQAEGWHYLSMEYVDGETLASLLHRIGALPVVKAVDVARQLCAGLAAAHERGVLHRDLKPSNIMLDGRGRVRIVDFGLAVSTDDTAAAEVAGTPAYMAPEQFTGGTVTAQTDLYSLGLVLYEILTGRRPFAATSHYERMRQAHEGRVPALGSAVDAAFAEVVRACLERDPADRPASALQVAALLPGGDPIAAALAEGRVPSPDMLAAAAGKGTLRMPAAWALLASAVAGTLFLAWQGQVLTVSHSDLPRPPEVLAQRARDILAKLPDGGDAVDWEFWFDSVPTAAGAADLRFMYRQGPQWLVPQNLFRIVSPFDPPQDLEGMATVRLDPSGRLRGFSRIPAQRPSGFESRWSDVFAEAGLSQADFAQVATESAPLIPHDRVVTWVSRDRLTRLRVTTASLGGTPVYFDISDGSAGGVARRRVFTTRRPPTAEAILWVFVVVGFVATAVMARRHLRAGDGDLHGATKLGVGVFAAGMVNMVLKAHHVPEPVDELTLVLSTAGWAIVWATFPWLAYLSFEPYVRRIWPGTLVSWMRLLSGRLRDPLVGRDVLIGVLAGVAIATAMMLRVHFNARGAPDLLLATSLESLRSGRHLASVIVFAVLDGFQFALGGLFFLLLLRLVLHRTWPAAAAMVVVAGPMFGGGMTVGADLLYGVAVVLLAIVVALRAGLLALVSALMCERLLTRLPLTLDAAAWYLGSSLLIVILVLAAALCGFVVALPHRRSPRLEGVVYTPTST